MGLYPMLFVSPVLILAGAILSFNHPAPGACVIALTPLLVWLAAE